MQLHETKTKQKRKKKKRVGRGGKRGTYSGRGIKGQKSRTGARFEPIIRGLIKRYPKLRGYRAKTGYRTGVAAVNLQDLEKKFEKSEKVSPEILLKKQLIRRIKGKTPKVKILGKGDLTKPLEIENCQVSKQAKEKIEKAGGTVKISN
jgi:large subunit ribosomal protein L15